MWKMKSKRYSSAAKTLGFGAVLVAVMLSALPAHARPGVALNGTSFQGADLNGFSAQSGTYQGRGLQGGNPSGREAEAVDLGALALRAVRLPNGPVLPVARE
jgi:hypothetical protein